MAGELLRTVFGGMGGGAAGAAASRPAAPSAPVSRVRSSRPRVTRTRPTLGAPVAAGSSRPSRSSGAPAPTAWYIAQQIRQREQARSKPGFFKRLVSGVAGDAVEIVTGLDDAAVFIGGQVAGGGARLYDWTNLAGSDAAGRFADRRLEELKQAGVAMKDQYKWQYGPLFEGDFGEFKERFLENPLYVGLDVASVVAAGGKAATVGGKAARRAGVGREGGIIDRVAATSADSPHLARPSEVLRRGLNDEGAVDGLTLVRDRGLYSRNPLVREFVQRPVTEPLRRATRGAVTRTADVLVGENPGPLRTATIGNYSSDGRFGRQVTRRTEDTAVLHQDRMRAMTEQEMADFAEAVRRLDADAGARLTRGVAVLPGARRDPKLRSRIRQERDAMVLHATGLLGVPGLAPRANLAAVVDWMSEGIRQSKAKGLKTRQARRQVERLRELPDELLDYETLPPHVREAVDLGRKSLAGSQEKMVSAGFINEQTAEAVRGRAARELIGGEEDVADLLSPAHAERLRGVDAAVAQAREKAAALRQPAPRADALAQVREVRALLRRARRFRGRRAEERNALIAQARAKLDELDETSRAVMPEPAGDARVGNRAGLVRQQAELDEVVAEVERVNRASDWVREMAAGMTPQGAGYAGMRQRFRAVDEFIGQARDELRRLAEQPVTVMRSVDELVNDQTPLGGKPNRAGRVRKMTPKQMRGRAERQMQKEGMKPPSAIQPRVDSPTVRRAKQEEWDAWNAEVAGRVEKLRQAEEAAFAPLAPAEAVREVARELSRAGRRGLDVGARRVAELVGYRVQALEYVVSDRVRRVEVARAAEAARSNAKTRAAVRQAEAELAMAERARVIAVERRLVDAEPEVRAEAIARGLIDEYAQSRNPRVLVEMLQRKDDLDARALGLRQELGLADEVDPDTIFFEGRRDPYVERSAREVRAEGAARHGDVSSGQAAISPRELRARQRQAERMFGGGDGPAAAARGEIDRQVFDRQAVGRGYIPGEVADEIAELTDRLVEVEGRYEVARVSQVGKPADIRRADQHVKRLQQYRKRIGTRQQVVDRVRSLEQRLERDPDKFPDALYDELQDLRELMGSDRSAAVPAEYRDVLPKIKEFVAEAGAGRGEVLRFDPDIDALPAVVSADRRVLDALDRIDAVRAAVDELDDQQYAGQMGRALKDVEQAYFEAREARVKGLRDLHGVEWVDNPGAEHMVAVPLDKVRVRLPAAYQAARGRLTQPKPKQGGAVLRPSGNFQVEPGGIVETRRFANVVSGHADLVADMIDQFAARVGGSGNDLVRGDRALSMMRSDPNGWVPVTRKSLEGVFRKVDEVGPGEFVDQGVVDSVLRAGKEFVEGEGREIRWKRSAETGELLVSPDEVFLIPRETAKAWAESLHPKHNWYDSGLDLWKAGVLVFTPRWYLYNLFGNTVQYGLMSMGDVRSIRDVWRYRQRTSQALGDAGADVHQASLVRDLGRDPSLQANAMSRVVDTGFRINSRMEGLLRDAAMLSATRKELRRAGKVRPFANVDEVLNALDNLPPESRIVKEAAKTAKLFMGEYRRFNTFERAVLRRVFPFYSWIRVISRLALSMPVKAPIRSELMALSTQMAYLSMDQDERGLESLRPVWDRGGVKIPGTDLEWNTTGINPFTTPVAYLEAIGNMSGSEFLAATAPSMTPPLSGLMQQISGRSVLGQRDFLAPPGWGGRVTTFGRPDLWINPVTRVVETAPAPTPSAAEQMAQSFIPFYASTFRGLVAGDRRPYDTASTPRLLANRVFGWGDDWRLWRPDPKYGVPTSKVGPGGAVSILGSLLGVSMKRRDEAAELAQIKRLWEEYQRGDKTVSSRIRRIEGAP